MNQSPVAVGALVLLSCSQAAAPSPAPGASGGSGGLAGSAAGGGVAGGGVGGAASAAGAVNAAGGTGAGGGASTGGSSGASAGGAGSGGLAGTDGAAGGSGGSGGAVGSFGGALQECDEPSIDRLKGWNATTEGTMVPQDGSLLVPDGAEYAAEVEWLNAEWHVVPVVIGPVFETSVDLTASAGLELTYSATDAFYVQMRSAAHWSGGAQYIADIPATSGVQQTLVISFAEANWGTRQDLGIPTWTYAENLADVRGLVFVGNTPNSLRFTGLRIQGYDPACD